MGEIVLFEKFYDPFRKRIEEAGKNYQEQVQRIQGEIKDLDDPKLDAQVSAKRQILNLDIKRAIGDDDSETEKILRAELARIERDYTLRQEQKKRRLSELQEEKSRGEAEKERLIREVHSEFIPLAEDIFLQKLEDICDFYERVEPTITAITKKHKHLQLFELGGSLREKTIYHKIKRFLPQL